MSDIKNQFNNSNFTNTEFVNYNGKKILKHLGSIPVRPDVFIGRENSTQEIHKYFQGDATKNVLLLVNGKGGIGKTTMASQYYHEYTSYYKHLIWLVSEKGIKEAIVSLAFRLNIKFPPDYSLDQQLEEVLRYVLDLKNPILLVIDNANDLEDLKDNEHILRKFQNVDILLTSRIDNYKQIESYKVQHLHPKAADTLFKRYYEAFQDEEQALLDELLKAIGYNTLVIELLAKNLHEFNTGLEAHYPLEKLLKDIQEKGVLAIQKSTKIHINYQKLEATTPEAIINSMYDIAPLSDEEKQVLSIFGVLPTTVLPYADLKQFLPNIDMLDRVLIDLSKKGWIDYDEKAKSFKTNPIISEIVRVQNKERLEQDTVYLIGLFINKLEYQPGVGHIEGDFESVKKIVGYAETFVNYSALLNYKKSVTYERLGNFYKTYGNLELALSFFETNLELTKELYKSYPNHVGFKHGLAISYSKLGDAHSSLGNLEQALSFFEKYLELRKELYESHPNHVDFKKGLAISYEKLGGIHTALGNLEQALLLYKDEVKLMEELHKSNSNNVDFKNGLAISYSKLGETHNSLGNLEQALSFYEEDMKLTKELYKSNSNNVSFKHGLAISYSKLGETYSLLGNLEQAFSFFEDGVKLFKELNESHPNNVGFKNDLAISYSKLGKIYSSLDNLELALSFFEEDMKLSNELYESNPSHVGFKNGLAISYYKIGTLYVDKLDKKEKGVSYLQKALTIWKALTEKHPSYVEFQENYKEVKEKLQSLNEN